jgi:hypothetical protein
MANETAPQRFAEPESCEDATERIEALLERKRGLEFLLSDKRRLPEVLARRPKAKRNIFEVEREIRYLKGWLRRRRKEIEFLLAMDEFCINRRDLLSVLGGAFRLLGILAKRCGGVSANERIVINLIGEALKDRGFMVSQQRGG